MPILPQIRPQKGISSIPPTREASPAPAKALLPRAQVLPDSERLCELLRPFCDKIVIAGSLRREKPQVGDIEIVCLPCPQADATLDMFGGDIPGKYVFCKAFEEQLSLLRKWGTITLDPANVKDGPRYKRFALPELGGFGVDLFLAEPDNWGNTLAIRTGPREFSQFLMTQAWKRRHRRQWDGYLWQCKPGDDRDGPIPAGRTKISCKTEEDYFRAVGVPWLPPCDRSEAGIELLKREAGRA